MSHTVPNPLTGYTVEGRPSPPSVPDGDGWHMNQETPSILINHNYCKKCGICIAVCPEDVYQAGPDGGPIVVQPAQCIWCEQCEMYCPDFALILLGDKGW
ncbi:MAG: 4Fe-4S binding protein [Thermaerobacter sp.]|nr:4Fe-4S binding protein [Thermaerobacter sp.]